MNNDKSIPDDVRSYHSYKNYAIFDDTLMTSADQLTRRYFSLRLAVKAIYSPLPPPPPPT